MGNRTHTAFKAYFTKVHISSLQTYLFSSSKTIDVTLNTISERCTQTHPLLTQPYVNHEKTQESIYLSPNSHPSLSKNIPNLQIVFLSFINEPWTSHSQPHPEPHVLPSSMFYPGCLVGNYWCFVGAFLSCFLPPLTPASFLTCPTPTPLQDLGSGGSGASRITN